MKKFILLAALALALSMPAYAQSQDSSPGKTPNATRNTPVTKGMPAGRTTTVYRGGSNPVIIKNNDGSLAYQTLVAPYARNHNAPIVTDNTVPLSAVNSACGGATSAGDKNRCIRDLIKAQERAKD